MKEQDIQHAIMTALRERGCYVVKIQAGAFKNSEGRFIQLAPAGTAGLLIGRPDGLFGAIECKAKGGVLSHKQRLTLRDMDKRGLCYAVMDDPADVETWLRDRSWHGNARYVEQIWTDVPEPQARRLKPLGLEHTPWGALKAESDARRVSYEQTLGEPPF